MDKIKENVIRQLMTVSKDYFADCFEKGGRNAEINMWGFSGSNLKWTKAPVL